MLNAIPPVTQIHSLSRDIVSSERNHKTSRGRLTGH